MFKYFETLLKQKNFNNSEVTILTSVYSALFVFVTYLIICKVAYFIGYFIAKFSLL